LLDQAAVQREVIRSISGAGRDRRGIGPGLSIDT